MPQQSHEYPAQRVRLPRSLADVTRYPPATLSWVRAVLLSGDGALAAAGDAVYALPDIEDRWRCLRFLQSIQRYLSTAILTAIQAEEYLVQQQLLSAYAPLSLTYPDWRTLRACVRALDGRYPPAIIRLVLRLRLDRRIVIYAIASLPDTVEEIEACSALWERTYLDQTDPDQGDLTPPAG